MSATDFILLGIAGLIAARLVQAHYQHREAMRWHDALGDMLGDMLRAILDQLKGGEK